MIKAAVRIRTPSGLYLPGDDICDLPRAEEVRLAAIGAASLSDLPGNGVSDTEAGPSGKKGRRGKRTGAVKGRSK